MKDDKQNDRQGVALSDAFKVFRTGFKTTRVCGPDNLYEINIKYRSIEDLHEADDELRAALSRASSAQGVALSKDAIREVFMAHGFTVKEGQTDLKPYVYDAAYALLARTSSSRAEVEWAGDAVSRAGVAIVDLAQQWADNKIHVYQLAAEAEQIVRNALAAAEAPNGEKRDA